ncbi:putative E3 ubiquitin ligase complex SCF subunit sconB [Lasiodiplodia hormozganensis]|uniref:E3 ubiquitin ligase complex SCF subunit sconB n=1 Tax=Lasiodiplodia hormozganensis TaxID=869390 RepID=A0AA39XP16_9PEZI|nr:putative E3 ubiquitin ligase complex SCF subunit sconB [Lasiodiplodia hormozganensis]
MAQSSQPPAASPSLFHDPHAPPARRLSLRHPPQKELGDVSQNQTRDGQPWEHDHHDRPRSRHHLGSDEADKEAEDKDDSISISSTSKQAAKTVQPFLAQHIPSQYNPLGNAPQPRAMSNKSSTKYCYRHRPDVKCRRQANEPSMEQLQKELAMLSQSDQQGIAHVWSLFSAAPAKHRNLMLQGILAQCCFPQLSYVSAAVRDLIKIDFLAALPPELGFKILCYLDTTSLCKAAQVSRRWRQLADDDVVWHKMCEQHIDRKCTKCGWGLPLLEAKRLRTEKRQMQLRATGRGLNELAEPSEPNSGDVASHSASPSPGPSSLKRRISDDSSDSTAKRTCTAGPSSGSQDVTFQPRVKRPWKDVYKDRFKVGTNWKYGRCSTKILRGHTNGIMCLQFDDNILATGSYDATIKIWDINTGEEIRTLTGHTAGVRCLQFEDNRLFSGGLDRTIRLWNWKTGELLRTFPGHTGGIVSLHFANNILATGSMDHTIRVWNFPDKSTFNLKGHTDWVNAVKIDGASRTIFSASDDCTVRLWDLDTKRCLKTYHGHVGQVQQVLPMPPEFELDDEDVDPHSDHDHEAETPDADPQNMLRYFNGPITPPYASDEARAFYPDQPQRPQPPRYMITGALDGTIRLWSVATGRCLRTFFGHVEGVWAIAADTLRLVSGAEDRMVKVWDPRSGRHERTFTGHAGPVTCIGLSDSKLVSAGEDCEVRIMSFGCGGEHGVTTIGPARERTEDTVAGENGGSQPPASPATGEASST